MVTWKSPSDGSRVLPLLGFAKNLQLRKSIRKTLV